MTAGRVRVMVSIAAQRGDGPWSRVRTLTIGTLEEAAQYELWAESFPQQLRRALSDEPEGPVEDPEELEA